MGSELKLGGPFREKDDTGLPWHDAPAASHVESFRFYDQRKYRLLATSEIHVRFKPRQRKDGSVIPMTEYVYLIGDAVTASRIFFDLLGAEHPGEVIHRQLINKYRYRQTV